MNASVTASDLRRGSGDLPRLLDPVRALDFFREAGLGATAVERTYVRLKPGEAAIVGYRFHHAGEGGHLAGYVRTSPDDRARVVAEKWSRMKPRATPLGPGVRLLPGGRSVLFLFPNDAALRGLHAVADLRTLKRILAPLPAVGGRGFRIQGRKSMLEVVRYKPERRFLAKLHLALKNDATAAREVLPAFLRFFPDARGERLNAVAEHLRHFCDRRVRIAAPLGCAARGRIQVEEALPGRELMAVVLEGDAPMGRVAEALAALHRAPPPPSAPARPARESLAEAVAIGESIAASEPGLGPAIQRLLRRLEAFVPAGGPAFIHGDFHFRQALLQEDGGIAVVDFERAASGDPFEDAGNLVAHLVALALDGSSTEAHVAELERSFVSAYLAAAGAAPRAAGDLDWFVATGLLRLAFLPHRRDDQHGPALAARFVDAAARRVGADPGAGGAVSPAFFEQPGVDGEPGASWEVFHPRIDGAWPGHLADARGATRIHGSYDPGTRRFTRLAPEDDAALRHGGAWLGLGELVSYRAGRRATIRVPRPDGTVWAKVLVPGKAKRLAARHGFVADLAGDGLPRFAPLLEDRAASEGVLLFGDLPGVSLHDELMAGRADPALSAAAAALVRFQRVWFDTGRLPPAPDPADLAALADLARRHAGMSRLDWRAAHGALPGAPASEGPMTLVHGDLHDRNILWDGTRISFLDLDLLHAGDPAEDAGNLAAHVALRGLQRGEDALHARAGASRFIEAFREAGGTPGDAALEAATARTFFRLACIYAFRRRWRPLVPALLELARP